MKISDFLIIFYVILSLNSYSQNVGISDVAITPDASSMLEIRSTTKGLLIPRIALSATTSALPVTSPATSLLIYNTASVSDVTPGYYYWDGTRWVRMLSGTGCVTLDGAYDCGGSGFGRAITSDAGGVDITVPIGSTSVEGLKVTINKLGTSSVPVAGVYAQHATTHGVGLYGEVTSAGNYYAGIQGFSLATNSTAGTYPTGVSGYFDGTGTGVGVWGETTGSGYSTASGAGVYGNGQGNYNWGGWFYSLNYGALNARNDNASVQAAQITSAGSSYLNPGLVVRGCSQFDCSTASQHSVIINNLAGEPTVAPSAGQWGYLGTSSVAWYYLYYFNAINASKREYKRDIQSFDIDLYEMAMMEIMKLKPSLYKYNHENDELVVGQESKTRFNYHLGLILDETPDFIQDNAFSGIDIYALSTLNVAGIQYLNKELENVVAWASVSDFGHGTITVSEIQINYSSVIMDNTIEGIPVVTVSPTSAGARYYIKEQTKTGFIVVSENGPMTFNWNASARKAVLARDYNIPQKTMSQLRVDPIKKQIMINFGRVQQQVPLKLLDDADSKGNNTFRMRPLLNTSN